MKLIYADSGLGTLGGHHSSSGVALCRAFRDLGHEVIVLGHQHVVDELRQLSGAEPFFRAFTYGGPSTDPIAGWLTNFSFAVESTVEDLHRAWAEFGPFDLIYFNSVKPAQVAALGLWLKAEFVSPDMAPTVVAEFGTGSGLARSGTADDPVFNVRDPTAILYRYAVGMVGKEWIGRIAFVAVVDTIAEEFGFLLAQPVHVVPMPQPQPSLRRRGASGVLTIGLVGHQRPDKGYQFAPEFISSILQRHSNAKFVVHQSDPEAMTDISNSLYDVATETGRLEMIVGPKLLDEWFSLFDRCDIIALPYEPQRYAGTYSAIVGEALAAGAPVVVPAATTLAATVEATGRPGVTFDLWNAASIAEAIDMAIDDFPALAERAWCAGRTWRQRNGPEHFATAVLELGMGIGRSK